jgi:hypothetical protein
MLQLNMRMVVLWKQSDIIGSHCFQHAMFDVVMRQLLPTPAVDVGDKVAELFIGKKLLVADAFKI